MDKDVITDKPDVLPNLRDEPNAAPDMAGPAIQPIPEEDDNDTTEEEHDDALIQFTPEMVENRWRYGGELVTK